MTEAVPGRRLCALAELPDGQARGFDPTQCGHDSVFATRHGTRVRVWVDRCPHLGTTLPWRRHAYLDAAGAYIVCAAHGALFEPDSGRCVHGPCQGERLQALAFCIDHSGHIVLAEPVPGPQPA